jgi:hypothetical protein
MLSSYFLFQCQYLKLFDEYEIKKICEVHQQFFFSLKSIPLNYDKLYDRYFLNFYKTFLVSKIFISNYQMFDQIFNETRKLKSNEAKLKKLINSFPFVKVFSQLFITLVQRYSK